MAIELPEFATSGAVETEPTTGLKSTGWVAADQPPAGVFNWIHRTTYEAIKRLALVTAVQGLTHPTVGAPVANVAGTTDVPATLGVAEADGVLMAVVNSTVSGTDYLLVSTSTDGGASFTERYTDANMTPTEVILAEPGGWAIIPGGFSHSGTWYYSQTPFTSWTKVTGGTGDPINANGAGRIEIGSARQLAWTEGTTLRWIGATAEPVDGEWQSLALTSLISTEVTDVASGGGYVVTVGESGGSSRVAWAASSGGDVIGDWSAANLGSAGGFRSLTFDGTNFVALDDDNVVWVAADPSGSWTQGATVDAMDINDALLISNGQGLVVCHEGDAAASTFLAASYDGGLSFRHVVLAADGLIKTLTSGAQVPYLAIDTDGVVYGFDGSTINRVIRTTGA